MINYKHLHYFWTVAKEGGIARASERLHLTPQTISGQLSVLEESLGAPLFNRVGRHLELTDRGRMALEYANEIFSLGGELEEILRSQTNDRTLLFKVGVTDVVPKSIAYRLLAPSLTLPEDVRIICREGSLTDLLADLAIHKVDLIIADAPIPPNINVRGFAHLLGESGISFLATPGIRKQLAGTFPQNLHNAPLLLPGEVTAAQHKILKWFDKLHIQPKIVGEFDDSALMKAFGQSGAGIFITPTAIATEVEQEYGVTTIGQTNLVKEQYYAISVERKISHPAIAAITETARAWLTTESLKPNTTSQEKA